MKKIIAVLGFILVQSLTLQSMQQGKNNFNPDKAIDYLLHKYVLGHCKYCLHRQMLIDQITKMIVHDRADELKLWFDQSLQQTKYRKDPIFYPCNATAKNFGNMARIAKKHNATKSFDVIVYYWRTYCCSEEKRKQQIEDKILDMLMPDYMIMDN